MVDKKLLIALVLVCIPSMVYAGQRFNAHTNKIDFCVSYREEDGTPAANACQILEVPNDRLTDNGDGTFTLSIPASSGQAVILDLGDDASNESTDLGEIATTGDTNSIFTEPSADKLLIAVGSNWPTADAATALSANGANCSAGNAPLGVDASGAVESCFDVWTEAENTAAGYIANLSEDATPQLGGNLDANGSNIILDAGENIQLGSGHIYGDASTINFSHTSTGVNPLTLDIVDGTVDINSLTAANCDVKSSDGTLYCGTDAGGAETNSLETTITGIEDAELFIGNGSNSGTFVAVTSAGGDGAISNAGVLTIDDDEHNHTTTTISGLVDADMANDALDADKIVGDSTDDDDLDVAAGGTGVSTLTDGGVLLGSGAGDITAMAVLADGEIIVGDGATDPVAESGATLRTSIGVGTGDSPTFTGLTLTGALAANGDSITSDGVLVINATSTTSFNDESITNVGDIALDSLTGDDGVTITINDDIVFANDSEIRFSDGNEIQSTGGLMTFADNDVASSESLQIDTVNQDVLLPGYASCNLDTDAEGRILCGTDADSGGFTAWDDITDPDNNADKAITFDNATETTSFVATAAFGDVDIVQIQQVTGNPTNGTLLSLQTADTDVDTLTAGDGTNETVIQDDGKIVFTGTAQPKHRIFLSATAGICATTNGCTDATQSETTTNKVNFFGASFADDADDYWNTSFTMPENWDAGTITAAAEWTAGSCTITTADGVSFFVQAMALANGDPMDTAWGTAVETAGTCDAANDFVRNTESTAITVGDSPGAGDRLFVRVYRDVDDSDDDLGAAANFLGVWITYTADALSTED